MYRENEQAMANIRAPLFEDKVVDFIVEMAKVNERDVTLEQLTAEMEAEQKEAEEKSKPKKKSASKKKTATEKKTVSKKKAPSKKKTTSKKAEKSARDDKEEK